MLDHFLNMGPFGTGLVVKAAVCLAALCSWWNWLGLGAAGFRCYVAPGWDVVTGEEGFDLPPWPFLWLPVALCEDAGPQDCQVCSPSTWSDWWPWYHCSDRGDLPILRSPFVSSFYFFLQKAMGSCRDLSRSPLQAISAWGYAGSPGPPARLISMLLRKTLVGWLGGVAGAVHVNPWTTSACQNSYLTFGWIFMGSALDIEACSAELWWWKSFYHKWLLSIALVGSCCYAMFFL